MLAILAFGFDDIRSKAWFSSLIRVIIAPAMAVIGLVSGVVLTSVLVMIYDQMMTATMLEMELNTGSPISILIDLIVSVLVVAGLFILLFQLFKKCFSLTAIVTGMVGGSRSDADRADQSVNDMVEVAAANSARNAGQHAGERSIDAGVHGANWMSEKIDNIKSPSFTVREAERLDDLAARDEKSERLDDLAARDEKSDGVIGKADKPSELVEEIDKLGERKIT
jgi:hypothetical protein